MPFQLVAEEVVTMLRALPKLTYITLNSRPEFDSATTLTIYIAPRSQYAGTINGYLSRTHPPSDRYEPTTLRSVELDLSASHVTSPIPLAIYLSRVLPPLGTWKFH